MRRRLVLFDVDGTVSDGQINREGGTGQARPGIYEWLESLRLLGFELHLWSACGAGHARHVAEALGLDGIAAYHDKPHPAEPYKLREIVAGDKPATVDLIVDDSQEWLDCFVGIPVLRVRHAFEVLHPGSVFGQSKAA